MRSAVVGQHCAREIERAADQDARACAERCRERRDNRLTLDLGLRWDYRNVPYETHDKLFWINPANALGGLCFADKALLTNTRDCGNNARS